MPLDPAWRAIAKDQPDARPLRVRGEKAHAVLGWMEPCYCVNCGRSHGMISREWAAYVFCLCDDCVTTYGRPPVEEAPEALVRGAKEQ